MSPTLWKASNIYFDVILKGLGGFVNIFFASIERTVFIRKIYTFIYSALTPLKFIKSYEKILANTGDMLASAIYTVYNCAFD